MLRQTIIAIFSSLLIPQVFASPNPEGPAVFWKCKIKFSARSDGNEFLGLGDFQLKGKGDMRCLKVDLLKPKLPDGEAHVVTVSTQEELANLGTHLGDIDAANLEVRIPVKINFNAKSLAQVAVGRVYISGYSRQWTLTKDVSRLTGKFIGAKAYGALGVGFGGFTAVKVDRGSLSLQLGIHATQGLGVSYGLAMFELAVDEEV